MRWSLLAPRTVIPGGGQRPSGSVSWCPMARIAREMTPRSVAGAISPKAVCSTVPRGRVGLTFNSITSATSVTASVYNPSSVIGGAAHGQGGSTHPGGDC